MPSIFCFFARRTHRLLWLCCAPDGYRTRYPDCSRTCTNSSCATGKYQFFVLVCNYFVYSLIFMNLFMHCNTLYLFRDLTDFHCNTESDCVKQFISADGIPQTDSMLCVLVQSNSFAAAVSHLFVRITL